MRERTGLILGPLLFVAMLVAAPPDGMPLEAWRTAAVAVLMATWWITEAVPIPATALLPLILFPVLDIASIGEATSPYANPVIYLFLGGFLIAQALESCGLHKRLALSVLSVAGTRPANLIFGFMAATAFISMWVSNTATVVMMLPMATSIIAFAGGNRTFNLALLLGIAYAASIGGLGTLIGSPPNALFAGFMSESYGVQITFLDWMLMGVPIIVIALPFSWVLLTKWLFDVGTDPIAGGGAMLDEERRQLGPVSRGEWTVGTITALTAAAWVMRPLFEQWIPSASDTGIAVAGALLLFIVPLSWRPLRAALTWREAERLPWAVLILFGGGLSLAAAIQQSGLATWIGEILGALAGWPVFAVIIAVTAVVLFLTELTSNTATAAAFLPVVASLATGIGMNPMLLAIPTALAASCAFMMPVATPPNAIIYGSGHVSIQEMARAGVWLNLFFVILLPVAVLVLATRILGI